MSLCVGKRPLSAFLKKCTFSKKIQPAAERFSALPRRAAALSGSCSGRSSFHSVLPCSGAIFFSPCLAPFGGDLLSILFCPVRGAIFFPVCLVLVRGDPLSRWIPFRHCSDTGLLAAAGGAKTIRKKASPNGPAFR